MNSKIHIFSFLSFVFRIEPRAWRMLGKHSLPLSYFPSPRLSLFIYLPNWNPVLRLSILKKVIPQKLIYKFNVIPFKRQIWHWERLYIIIYTHISMSISIYRYTDIYGTRQVAFQILENEVFGWENRSEHAGNSKKPGETGRRNPRRGPCKPLPLATVSVDLLLDL
jgi:hypothetical protein